MHTWTASNGIVFTDVVEVLEGQTFREAPHANEILGNVQKAIVQVGECGQDWKLYSDNACTVEINWDAELNGNDITYYPKLGYYIAVVDAILGNKEEGNVMEGIELLWGDTVTLPQFYKHGTNWTAQCWVYGAYYGNSNDVIVGYPNQVLTYDQLQSIAKGGYMTIQTRYATGYDIYNGIDSTPQVITAYYNIKVQVPSVPQNPGNYTFKGWLDDDNNLLQPGQWYQPEPHSAENNRCWLSPQWVSVISWNYNGTGGTDGLGGGNGSVEVIKGQSWNLPWAGNSSYTWRGWFWDAGFAYWAGDQNGVITPTGNATVYAKWVSIVIFNFAQSESPGNNKGWRQQAPIEVVKGQACQGIDPYPEASDVWNSWRDSYITNGNWAGQSNLWWGSGNKIMDINGSFVPNGGTINLYPGNPIFS